MNTYVPFLSVIVPCYHEAEGLGAFHQRISAVCLKYQSRGYEVIYIDDGSSDQTWDIIQALSRQDSHVRGLSLSRNFGHSMALTAGLEFAHGDRIFIIDADLQDPPELLDNMMSVLDAGADVAYGKRIYREGETYFKKITASLFYRLVNYLSDTPLPKDAGDFRLMTRRVLDTLLSMPETTRYTRGMIAWIGFKQVSVEYSRKPRFSGKTHYTFRKMLDLAVSAVLSFSIRPLRLAVHLGFFMLFVSTVLLAYILYAYFFTQTVHGWASLAFILVTLQAIQFLILGIIGEYVGRIFQEVKNRPKYIIRDSIDA